jgi:MoaA/NifB/PqqE/SkfB family radical SAM enzyme
MPAGTSSIGPLDGLLERLTGEKIEPDDYNTNIGTQLELLKFVAEDKISEEEIFQLARMHMTRFFTPNQRGLNKVSLSVNEICNLRCRHCYYENTHIPNFEPASLINRTQWEKIITYLSRRGYRRFCIAGKEPLLTPNTTSLLVEHISDIPGAQLELLTNGTLIKDNLSWLNTGNTIYGISIDGNEASHDLIRGSGNYQRAKEGIEELVQLVGSRRVVVNITLMPHNAKSIIEGIKDMQSVGARYFKIGACFPTQDNNGPILEPSYEDFVKLCRGLEQLRLNQEGAVALYLVPEENAPIIVGMWNAGLFDKEKLIRAEKQWRDLLNDSYVMLPTLSVPLDEQGRIAVTIKTLPTHFYGNFRIYSNGKVGDGCIDLTDKEYMANSLGNILEEGLEAVLDKMPSAFEAHVKRFYQNFRKEFRGEHAVRVEKTY